jgi:ankyrin repeat protein
MTAQKLTAVAIFAFCLTTTARAQSAKVDFAKDVQPIFRQNCVGCHGPSQALSGFRIDRKSSAFKDGFRRIVAGSSQNSFLYHRLVGTAYGMQMPPTGALKPEQIATIKAWIDQGAEWPDSLSNEAERASANPKAIAAIEKLRQGDTAAFRDAVNGDPKLVNAQGPEGSTPFMYAALYGDAAMLEQLIKKGADPNVKNFAGATALMWAATDLSKTRVLLDHGADVNAISEDNRTALMIAASLPNGRSSVKLLLDHKANTNPTHHPDTESSPLNQAALSGDPEIMRMLIAHGANVQESAEAMGISLFEGCRACFDLLNKYKFDKKAYTAVLQSVSYFADAPTVRSLLDHGAAIDEPDGLGHTPLAYAAGSDLIRPDVVKLLIDRGANVNSKSPHPNSMDSGMTVLDVARLRGETPVTALLVKAGATSAKTPIERTSNPDPAASIQVAVQRALPILQRGDAGFTAKSGCISCHNDSLIAMAVGMARSRGFRVDEALDRKQIQANVAFLTHQRDLMHQFTSGGDAANDTFGPHIPAYQLMGFAAESYTPDLDTDAAVMYIKSRQALDGSWPYAPADTRPPLCSDHIGQTSLCMRALQLYAPKQLKAEYEKAVDRASAWLAKAVPVNTEDTITRLLGLGWANRDKDAIAKARAQLLALQRADGSWGDLPSMPSSAYATGKALVALNTGGLAVSDPAYQRGIAFLLKNQMADGSWFVQTRALAFQPFFETGFPHGVNQSISAAGTAWSTMALLLAAPEPAGKTESRAAR